MSGRRRSFAPRTSTPWRWTVFAVVGAVGMVWAHTWRASVNDYAFEAAPAFTALLHGHLASFLALAPAYGGSLELRAPFALIASLAGAGELEIFRASAVPCALAAAGLGVWLVMQMERRGSGLVARGCVLCICVLNPITYEALAFGHPEELLGAALCVGAVLCAAADRPVWAGLLLGLAIGNKEWALVGVGPVLVALPSGHFKALAVAGAVAALMLVPIVLAAPGGLAGSTGRLATKTGDSFYPQQVWWFLGHRLHWVPAMAPTIRDGSRTVPAWLDGRAHLIIVGVMPPLSLLYHRSKRASRSPLLLLALLLLLRCILDPWDAVYYPLPFILALVSWESVAMADRVPIRSLAAIAATLIVFVVLPKLVGVDAQSIACLVVALPATALIACSIYGPLGARRWLSPSARPVAGGRSVLPSLHR
jgi:hypothetical protein